ncbi:membrane hypothetical protein [Verrucomicrobia bacterium]|nr:membrane hypothetical protein [Verrucomicrobiota bacterium]
MKNPKSKTRLGVAFFLASLLAALTANAQPYTIDWYKVAGGGGTSTSAVFAVSGTIGQHDAGGPMKGGTFSLTGGFWALYALQTPGAPSLTIYLTSTNTVVVSWPSPSPGFVLQQNTDLSTTNWAPPLKPLTTTASFGSSL